MKQLLEIAEKFDRSRPIFRLTVDNDGDMIDMQLAEPEFEYKPELNEDDAIQAIVASNFEESFSVRDGQFFVDHKKIADTSMSVIRNKIGSFIEHNLEMRNPRQSKLYRWVYRGMPNTEEFNEILVLLYKYIRSFANEDMQVHGNLELVSNTLALLTAMEEKHNESR